MPEMNGFQVAKTMRSNARTANTPVIFVTAYPQDELGVREGYNSGAVDFLFKPVDPALLRSVRLPDLRHEVAGHWLS